MDPWIKCFGGPLDGEIVENTGTRHYCDLPLKEPITFDPGGIVPPDISYQKVRYVFRSGRYIYDG